MSTFFKMGLFFMSVYMKVPAMCEIDFFLDIFVLGLSLCILSSSNQPDELHKTGKCQFFFSPMYA